MGRSGAESVAGPEDSIQAFDTMCHSDVLIAGKSGFSHLAATLCRKPVVLAIPFWHTFDCLPNALVLQPKLTDHVIKKLNTTLRVPTELYYDIDKFKELVSSTALVSSE